MIQSVWNELPDRFPGAAIDASVIMPNHVHGIIVLTGDAVGASTSAHPVGATTRGCPDGGLITYDQDGQAQGPAPTDRVALPDVVHRFKSLTAAKFRHGVKHAGWPPFRGWFWQRNYWEHVIRDERALQRIRGYFVNNPARWAEDRMHPEAPTNGFVGGPRWRRGGTATCVDWAGTGAFAYRAAMMEG